MGVIDGSTRYGDIIGAGLVGSIIPPKVVADPNRRSLSRTEWMSEFFNTLSNRSVTVLLRPISITTLTVYSFEPKSDVPDQGHCA